MSRPATAPELVPTANQYETPLQATHTACQIGLPLIAPCHNCNHSMWAKAPQCGQLNALDRNVGGT